MRKQRAERGGMDRAEDSEATIRAVPLYGTGNGSWREKHQHIFATDSQLRWFVDANRSELLRANALGLFKHRLFGLEPAFTTTLLRLAREHADTNAIKLQHSAQQAADAFVAGSTVKVAATADAQAEALGRALGHDDFRRTGC